MASTRSGHIPKKLRIFSRKTQTFTLNDMFGRGGWWRARDRGVVHSFQGRKGFAVDVESKSSMKTAERWSKAVAFLAPTLDRLQILFDTDDEVWEDRDNSPMTGLRIMTLEHRGQGGRAYKVLTEDGYVYDLREDQLLEAMVAVGIERGGVLGGEWVWGIIGSQMKLIRVGSAQHEKLAQTTAQRAAKKISARDLKVGTIYARSNGDRQLFCGFVTVPGQKGKMQLWWEPYSWRDLSEAQGQFNEDLLEMSRPSYSGQQHTPARQCRRFKLTKSHSCKSIDGTIEVPEDVVEIVRGVWHGHALERYASFCTRRTAAGPYQPDSERGRLYRRGNQCPNPEKHFLKYDTKQTVFAFATMTSYGTTYTVPEDIRSAIEDYEAVLAHFKAEKDAGRTGGYHSYYSNY